SLLLSPLASAGPSSAPNPPAAAPQTRDGRRVAVVVGAREISLVAERDDRIPKEVPNRIELRLGGRSLKLVPKRKVRYGGDSPGEMRSYSARMPRLRTAESLVLSDAAPAGSEPVRVSVSVDPAFCVTSA